MRGWKVLRNTLQWLRFATAAIKMCGMNLRANTGEAAYIREVLNLLKVKVPDGTPEWRREVAARTLFRLRLWDVIYRFRIHNYSIRDVLDEEYISDQ